MKRWRRHNRNSSSSSSSDEEGDEDSTYGPRIPDPVIEIEDNEGFEDNGDEEDADTMTILAEGTRATFCLGAPDVVNPSTQHTRSVSFADDDEGIPESSSWLSHCCNKADTAGDGVTSDISTPSWFSGTAEDKAVERKAAEFAASVDEVSRGANIANDASDRAIADFDTVSEESMEIKQISTVLADEENQQVASPSPSPERKRFGFAALVASMFPGNSDGQDPAKLLNVEDDGEEDRSSQQESVKIVGVTDELVDDSMSYADKDDNTPNGTIGLIPLQTLDVTPEPETGPKSIDRDSATENASDTADGETKSARSLGCRRWYCLGLFLILFLGAVGVVLGTLRPGKIGKVGSRTSQSIEAGSNTTDVEPVVGSEPTGNVEIDANAEAPPVEEPTIEEPTVEAPTVAPTVTPTVAPTKALKEALTKAPTAVVEPSVVEGPTVGPLAGPAPKYFATLANAPFDVSSVAILTERLASVNAEFVVHVGNIRSESSDCLYEDYERAASVLISSGIPVFVVPGPNDWSVCDDPESAIDNYTAFFTNFTETNWSIRRVRRNPQNPSIFSWRYSADILILGVDLVDSESNPIENKIQETVAWTQAALTKFVGARLIVFAYSMPQKFVNRLKAVVPLSISITYVTGEDTKALLVLSEL